MDAILIDTNVLTLLLTGDSRAQSYASRLWGRRLAISFVSAGELFQWAAVRHWDPPRVDQLAQRLQDYVILPFDAALCRRWGEVRAQAQAAGHPISSQAAWIAATALQYRLPLATHDPGAFKIVPGLDLITVRHPVQGFLFRDLFQVTARITLFRGICPFSLSCLMR